jgi:hypothetical protein
MDNPFKMMDKIEKEALKTSDFGKSAPDSSFLKRFQNKFEFYQ